MKFIISLLLILFYPFAYLSLLCCYDRIEDREYYMKVYKELIKKGLFLS